MDNNTIKCMYDPFDFDTDLAGHIDLVIPEATTSGAFFIRYASSVTVNEVFI